jgi:hypothetical protein
LRQVETLIFQHQRVQAQGWAILNAHVMLNEEWYFRTNHDRPGLLTGHAVLKNVKSRIVPLIEAGIPQAGQRSASPFSN